MNISERERERERERVPLLNRRDKNASGYGEGYGDDGCETM